MSNINKLIKRRVFVFSVFAFFISVFIILLAYPREHSFWGESFFGIPYLFSLIINPLVTSLITYSCSSYILKNISASSHFSIGALISCLSFIGYALFHSIIAGLFEAYNSFEFGFSLALTLFGVILMFGGIFILPILITFSSLISYITYKSYISKAKDL